MEAVSCTGRSVAPAEEYRHQLRQRLAKGTRRMRWTYSIFWSFCPQQQVLVWEEGYLDGADSSELTCLRRSQQLRHLYHAMDASRAGARGQPFSTVMNPTIAAPSITPQDLTPLEWFYVGSMAVKFASGDGLPGLVLGGRGHVWHTTSSESGAREFVRARLAQRARLQTIVCIPARDGVFEIGTTALVEQDSNLLQQFQFLFLEHEIEDILVNPSSSVKAKENRALEEMWTSPSSFKNWRASSTTIAPPLPKRPQLVLKAAVMTVPRLLTAAKEEVYLDYFPTEFATTAVQNFNNNSQQMRRIRGQSKHVMAERKRRDELNKRFDMLRKLVPFVTKPNKEHLLADAIEYVVELQRQVTELESVVKRKSEEIIKQHVDVTIEKSMAFMKISSAWQDDHLIKILQKMEDLELEVIDVKAKVFGKTLKATLKAKVKSSNFGSEGNKTAEIQAALFNLIEGSSEAKQ